MPAKKKCCGPPGFPKGPPEEIYAEECWNLAIQKLWNSSQGGNHSNQDLRSSWFTQGDCSAL